MRSNYMRFESWPKCSFISETHTHTGTLARISIWYLCVTIEIAPTRIFSCLSLLFFLLLLSWRAAHFSLFFICFAYLFNSVSNRNSVFFVYSGKISPKFWLHTERAVEEWWINERCKSGWLIYTVWNAIEINLPLKFYISGDFLSRFCCGFGIELTLAWPKM